MRLDAPSMGGSEASADPYNAAGSGPADWLIDLTGASPAGNAATVAPAVGIGPGPLPSRPVF